MNLKNNARMTSKNTFMLGFSNHYLSLPFHKRQRPVVNLQINWL